MTTLSHQAIITDYLASVKLLASEKDFYTYEEKFSKLHTALGNKILELSINEEVLTASRYKKKLQPDTMKLP